MKLRPHFNSIAQGAAQQNISKTKVAETLVLVPDQGTLELFARTVGPLWEQVRVLALAVRKLAQLRDLLLPRLISGEINLGAAEY